jgi:hypothetical protein
MMTGAMDRRGVLKLLGALGVTGSGVLHLPGCGLYAAESGEAFAPWDFPGAEPVPERIVARAALLASSPHNTQPWALAITPEVVELRARLDRHLGAMDGLRRELHIGLGCALENMVVAARASGRTPTVQLLPDAADEALVARVSLAPAAATSEPLFEALARRHTNRGAYADVDAPPGLEDALRRLVDEPTVSLHWFGARAERERLRAETIAATEAIIGDPEMSQDGHRWYRHGKEDIERFRDGTTIDATGNGAAIRTLGKLVGRPGEEAAGDYWLDATIARQTTGSAFAILSSPADNTRADQLRVGRLYQRMHLFATLEGLAMQPLNQLAERQDREEVAGLERRFTDVLASLIGPTRRAQMIFRIGHPWHEAPQSPRRPLEWVTT